MTHTKVYFNNALNITFNFLSTLQLSTKIEPIVLRDQFGKIRLLIRGNQTIVDELKSKTKDLWLSLENYANVDGKNILGEDDFFDLSVFESPEIVKYQPIDSDKSFQLLDRQVTGQGWLKSCNRTGVEGPGRIVFYGLKGGVGRSTAMALYAYHLSISGKKVLAVDLDLESPGLSNMMLPLDRIPEFGIVDWLVEDGISKESMPIERVTAISPISDMGSGSVIVASAIQHGENNYISKLSRIYGDIPTKEGSVDHFYDRIQRFISGLEEKIKPDIVLIDSRAGLHDLAAVSITGLADKVLMFGSDSEQSWQGYRLLFTHWQQRPDLLKMIRERLAMVYALFPEVNQSEKRDSYLNNAYDLFADTIYEEIPAGASKQEDYFNFDLNDESAPHYPVIIKWNQRFQEFSAELIDKVLKKDDINSAFGEFFEKIDLWSN